LSAYSPGGQNAKQTLLGNFPNKDGTVGQISTQIRVDGSAYVLFGQVGTQSRAAVSA